MDTAYLSAGAALLVGLISSSATYLVSRRSHKDQQITEANDRAEYVLTSYHDLSETYSQKLKDCEDRCEKYRALVNGMRNAE